jgi:glyoxylase-like metal-dependent hydrolase (beta-lactamase superfamily II)
MKPTVDEIAVTLLPSATGPDWETQYTTSFLVNDTILVDAGSAGFWGGPGRQARIRHVLLTHGHADHVGSLPMLLENTYDRSRPCIEVRGIPDTLACLRESVFNGRFWPDLLDPEQNYAKLTAIRSDTPFVLDGLRFTPVDLHHTVPTVGYVVESARSAVVIGGDTGPTDRIWEVARACANLEAVFLECAVPNERAALAEVSRHLTPELFRAEMEKVGPEVRFFAHHLKPVWRADILRQLEALGLPRLEAARPGAAYRF